MVFQQFFAHKVQTLIKYKKIVESEVIVSEEPSCTSEAFQSLVVKYFPSISWTMPKDAPQDNFHWPMTGYSVKLIRAVMAEPRSGKLSFVYVSTFILNYIT